MEEESDQDKIVSKASGNAVHDMRGAMRIIRVAILVSKTLRADGPRRPLPSSIMSDVQSIRCWTQRVDINISPLDGPVDGAPGPGGLTPSPMPNCRTRARIIDTPEQLVLKFHVPQATQESEARS